MPPITSLAMTINAWLASVLALIIGNLFSPSVAKALLVLARARAQKIKHVDASGAELYYNGVPMNEAQFREVYAAYRAELESLGPPAERGEWENAQAAIAAQRLSAITGTAPLSFPNVADVDEAWAFYRDSSPYATGREPRPRRLRLSPPGGIVAE